MNNIKNDKKKKILTNITFSKTLLLLHYFFSHIYSVYVYTHGKYVIYTTLYIWGKPPYTIYSIREFNILCDLNLNDIIIIIFTLCSRNYRKLKVNKLLNFHNNSYGSVSQNTAH